MNSQSIRPSIWIVLGGVLFALGWRTLVMAVQYLNEPVIVRELAAIPQFAQDLIPNHANTRLIFCQDTKKGVGIYFCDTAVGKPRLLCEQIEKGDSWMRFTMLGWTPDDSLFACAIPDKNQDHELVLIFDGRTGELLNKVVADQNFDQFGWLSNEAFAYSLGGNSVRLVARQAKGDWDYKRFFENVATNMDNFIVVSDSTVAWRDHSEIWLLNLNSGLLDEIWEATTNRLVEFTHVRGVNDLLLNCSDEGGQYLLRLNPQNKHTSNLGRINGQWDYIRKAMWDGQGSSYAFLTNDLGGSAFFIKTEKMEMPTTVSWQGGAFKPTLNGNHLFFFGNPNGQIPGIWDYNIESGTFKCIVSSTSGPLKNGIGTPSSGLAMTNSWGEQRYCHLWPPSHVLPGHKYPVLLAQELNLWYPYFQIAANSGFYVAVADRPFFHTWDGVHERTWTEDVSSLYNIVAHNPNIDTNRVYLLGNSSETCFLSQLMNDHPLLAKGAILFSPTGLPDVSILQNSHILLVDGKANGDATKQLSEFQDRAAAKGNDITLFLQDAAGHVTASGITEHNREIQFAKFMSDNR
jgi:hypothetical protein